MALFSPDSKFMKFIERLIDVIVLNFLWLLCSLPIVTLGASTAAAFSLTLKMVDDHEGYIFKPFFKAFKENLRQGTLLLGLNLAAVYILWLEWQLLNALEDPPFLLIIGLILSLAISLCAFVYTWPQLARYKNNLGKMITNSVRICLRYPLRTLLIFGLLAAEVFLFTLTRLMMLFGFLAGPIILIYTISGIAKPIFLELDKKAQAKVPEYPAE